MPSIIIILLPVLGRRVSHQHYQKQKCVPQKLVITYYHRPVVF
jgi:hypothetical protein